MDNPKTPNLFEQPNKAPLTQPPPESWVDKLVDRLQRIEEAHAKQVLDFSRLVDVLTDRQALSASRTYNIPANLSVIFEAMNGDFVLFSSSSPGPTLAITPTNLRIATPFTFASTQNFLLVPTPGGGSVSIQNTGTSSVSVTAQSLSLAQATAIAQSVGASGIQIAQLTGSLPAGTNTLGTVNVTGSGTTVPYLDIEGAPGVSVAAGATYQTPTLGTVAGFQGVWSVSAAWSAATTGNAYIHYPLPTGYQGVQLASIGSATAEWLAVATGQAGATTTHAPLQPIVYVTSDGLQFNNSGASAVTLNKYQGLIY